ncbi:MAG TPA: AzlC family ABC transporter permease [Burkholderiales bacterium]|nr:AzlC family ABC transporter permease [Burkholderiales bacterium]
MSRQALRQGAREAAGAPAAVLAAGYLGFGALAAGHDVSLPLALAMTAAIWALPAQLILVEMHSLGAAFVAVVVTVVLSSARFFPMTLMLLPLMKAERHRGWHYYAAAQLLSLTGWTMAVARFPQLPQAVRLYWFYGFTFVCIGTSALATGAGYLVAEALTPLARTGLVFMAPMYYLLILSGAVRERIAALSLACGAVAGPLLHLVAPQWSVLLAGLVGGSLAYALVRARVHG